MSLMSAIQLDDIWHVSAQYRHGGDQRLVLPGECDLPVVKEALPGEALLHGHRRTLPRGKSVWVKKTPAHKCMGTYFQCFLFH